ncbi:Calmodulin-regulated spectrin-associated protein 1-B [Echinococcus granulosus]|nr:Calmodulin-regulated spectrin-associated protein 1-B [Echinococcus granulosus]
MDPSKLSDLPALCWIVGCAVPINASSVCKYLFDRGSNCLKPQLKTSLISCQLYAAALSNIFHSERTAWRSFTAIYEQLRVNNVGCLPDVKRLCGTLEEAANKNEFCQATHVALIECLMRLSITKLAAPVSLEGEIRRLIEMHPQLKNVVDLSSSQPIESCSAEIVELYSHHIHLWLLSVAWIVIPELLQNRQVRGIDHGVLIRGLGFISLLSCAAYYYRSNIGKVVPTRSRPLLDTAPCLDAQLAAMSATNEPMKGDPMLEDDQLNAPRLFATLGGILEEKKGSGGKPDPPHISLITAALCALPHFVGSTGVVFSDLSALCSSAALFHWFTGSKWSRPALGQLERINSHPTSQEVPSPSETALKNSIALQILVRSSGGFAKKARPANPDNIPAALVDLNTVEQLVSSTTSDTSEGSKSTEKQQQEDVLLSELACTAALAVVDSPSGDGIGSSDAQKIKVFPNLSPPLKRTNAGSTNMNAFFLNKSGKAVFTASLRRSPACVAFKMNSPRIDDSPGSNTLETAEETTLTLLTQMTASATQLLTSQKSVATSRNCKRAGKTNWTERARQGEEKRSHSVAATPTETGKGSAALRLSLDQQRRTIEANRQRALRQGDKVAAHRNQAAFLALLHSSQKRRRQGANYEGPSLAEEEESGNSQKYNDDFTVSQSDLPPKDSAEEEAEGECVVKEKSEQNYSSSSVPDVETTDMEDFSSSCVPDQAEMSSNGATRESPIHCSSPVKSPQSEEIPTPRMNRRRSSCSTSSPSSPNEEIDPEEHRSVSRRRHYHRLNYEQPVQSARIHYRPESCCFQCSHCNAQDYYSSMPRRRHRGRMEANVDDGTLEENVDYEELYGTMPRRRVPKPPRGVRQYCCSGNNYRRGREFSPEDRKENDGILVNETASEIYWNTHLGRRRTPSSQHLRQCQLGALDSGEEFSYPVCTSALPPRPHRLELNHLGKSAGTGLDALVIAELARSVTTLRSDIERLTAQQLSLCTDLRDTDPTRSVPPVGSAHSSHLHPAVTPSSSTRAMWSTRTPLRYPSQCDVRNNGDDHVDADSPDHMTSEKHPLEKISLSTPEIKPLEPISPPESRATDDHIEAAIESPSPEPEVIKPAEKLFITFENPTSERLQRARERLEARRAADRSRLTESALRARMADQESQFLSELSEMARNVSILPTDDVFSTDIEPENSGFPVHTTNDNGTASNGEGGSVDSAIPPKPTCPTSALLRDTSATATAARRKTSAGAARVSGSGRNSRSASLCQLNVRSSVTSSSGNRSTTAGRVTSTNDRENATSVGRQRSASRRSINQLSNGPSLSSLHRLENGEGSTYSGPGFPIAGIQSQPRLYVKPKSKSNRQVIVNAISHCCLAGTVNEPAKKLALQELAAVDGSHFIVLFRDSRCQYRALYAFDFETEELKFICGNGPRKITHNMCDKFFKYNSGAKQFSEITSTKHLSAVVDAVTIQNSWWMRSPPLHSNAARATASAVKAHIFSVASCKEFTHPRRTVLYLFFEFLIMIWRWYHVHAAHGVNNLSISY